MGTYAIKFCMREGGYFSYKKYGDDDDASSYVFFWWYAQCVQNICDRTLLSQKKMLEFFCEGKKKTRQEKTEWARNSTGFGWWN